MSQLQERIVEVGGCRCRVREKGDGNTVGFLAGFRGTPRWTPFLDHLARSHRVVVPALPGFPGAEPGHRQLDDTVDWITMTLDLLEARGVPHVVARTWTTDAPYRETVAKVARRREDGCATVEMETAAFYAVARFRGVRMVQLLYAADDVSGETWDERGWMQASDVRHAMYRLGLDLVRTL